jgi:hypothetical protein
MANDELERRAREDLGLVLGSAPGAFEKALVEIWMKGYQARDSLSAPEGYVLVPQSALDWLFGQGPDANGEWFSDSVDLRIEKPRPYWWRAHFRKLIGGGP